MRAIALVALISAALFGGWTRWEERRDTPPTSLNALETLVGLRLNDNAVVEEVSSHPVEWVRLRLEECSAPTFLFLIPIESSSTPEVLTRSFASSGYKMVDVYRGEIQQEWNSVNRVFNYIKAAVAAIGRTTDQIYVRIYVRADCQMEERFFIDWASRIIAFSRPFLPSPSSLEQSDHLP
jgi:hypothetical protein